MVRDVAFAGRSRCGRFVLATCGPRTLAALTDGTGPAAARSLDELERAFYATEDPAPLRSIAARAPVAVSALVVSDDEWLLVAQGDLPGWRVGRAIERIGGLSLARGPLQPDEAVVLATRPLFEAADLARLDRQWPSEDLTELVERAAARGVSGVAIAVGACEPVVSPLRRAGDSWQRV
jgi:hypothetical protein